jgi:hypothetical protein
MALPVIGWFMGAGGDFDGSDDLGVHEEGEWQISLITIPGRALES